MAILKKKNLTKWIVFLPAFAVFLTFCIFLLIMVSSEKADYDKGSGADGKGDQRSVASVIPVNDAPCEIRNFLKEKQRGTRRRR